MGTRQALRFALLAGDNLPVLWDFGSAAVHHRLYCDWLPAENFRAGMLGMRGTVPPSAGLMKRHAEEIKDLLVQAGFADMPLGVDLIEPGMWLELERVGLKIVDGQQVMLDAREIKNIDEIVLLNQAAAMVDAVYHMIWEDLKPGVRENDIVARANKMLYELGSDDVEAINDFRRALQSSPTQFHGSLGSARRPGLLRHSAFLRRLSNLLLPDIQRRPRDSGST
jgi:Xaa-Pro aminopeptidase